jgi:hypothetical protein
MSHETFCCGPVTVIARSSSVEAELTGTSDASFPCMQDLRLRGEARVDDARADDVHALGTVDLLSGIVEDTRDLVTAHVEALRDDMSARLATLGATLASMLIAIGVFVVTAVLLSLAIASSLVAIGTPWWIALWIVTLAAGAIAAGFMVRARVKARAVEHSVVAAAARVRSDVAQIAIEQVPLDDLPTT